MVDDDEVATKLSVSPADDRQTILEPEEMASLVLGEELGRGESARVVEARFLSGRNLVLKIAHPGKEEILLREARALALSVGAHSPRLLGVGQSPGGGELCLAMELAEGRSLGEILRGDEEAYDAVLLASLVLTQVGVVLRQLHALGLSHGDVKPDNIMVGAGACPHITIIDFGMAKEDSPVEEGTPRYLPPEVMLGEIVRSRAADAYALALTTAEVLASSFRTAASAEEGLPLLPLAFQSILGPVLCSQGSVRPGVRFLLDEAQNHGILPSRGGSSEGLAAVRREYLATRIHELDVEGGLEILVEGEPGRWAVELRSLLVSIRGCSTQKQEKEGLSGRGGPKATFENFTTHDRRRFLGRLIGPAASGWRLQQMSDGALIKRILARRTEKSLASLIAADLSNAKSVTPLEYLGASEGKTKKSGKSDPIEWALLLGRRPVAHGLLEEMARSEARVPEPLSLEAARAARQAGDLSLARRLIQNLGTPGADFERAIIQMRAGNSLAAQSIAKRLLATSEDPVLEARAKAFCARALLDQGRATAALEALEGSPLCAEVVEVRALALLSEGRFDEALSSLDLGESLSNSDEELARLQGVRGMVQHARSQPRLALASFQRATELASGAGAALEEAIYCTGTAAAASDAGRLAIALGASERAGELFESLDQSAQNARALLARASVLAALGASDELGAVVRRGLVLARQGGDTVCEAYLLLCLCDGSSNLDERRSSAGLAGELLASCREDDRLRAAARLLSSSGQLSPFGDEWAKGSCQAEARLDWWRARAEILEKASSHGANSVAWASAQVVLSSLHDLCSEGTHLSAAGPAFVAGAQLALRVGMAEDARKLLSRGGECAQYFLRNAPDEYRVRAEGLLWVQQAQGTRMNAGTGAEQLSDVEGLLRALSQRQGFRSLLNQVLDMLLLWTGVERGLLLLRAPEGRLVIRAGRNLDRRELSAEQRTLSLSMAQRALSEGRPVVAVDAVRDHSQLQKSIHALSLRSVLAVPLVARGEVMGVAYLDDRVRRGAFGERELSWVQLIGTIAAVAIADERDRLLLQRALRRAKRAERRLAEKLSTSEVALDLTKRELGRLRDERPLLGDYSNIIGRGRAMGELLALVDRVAQSDVPVLIQGESGTGKELIARAIVSTGQRKSWPFITENCGAVPEALAESTFFGHHKGAFTGAVRNQAGLFELAHRGTLFLDEIGEMSLAMQTKLLRVLQEGEVRPLGAARPQKIDVRIIVATHQDLKGLVERGRFREDLFYRLNVVSLETPPLRNRPEDVPPLLEHFMSQYSPGGSRSFTQAVLYRLVNFPWPGNVRQLENEVRRMLVLGGDELTTADLSPEVMRDSHEAPEATTLKEKVDALERRLVIEALEEARGNRTRAAGTLGLSRFGLQKMTQRLSIEVRKPPKSSGAK